MMGGIGLSVKMEQMRRQGPSKKCERCGLSYFTNKFNQCPHCSDLNDNQLQSLLHRIEAESYGNAALGGKLLIIAIVLIAFIVFINL